MTSEARSSDAEIRRGAACGLLAAALFGVSAPVSKVLLADMSPQILAGLLYLGAGLGLLAYRTVRGRRAEAPIERSDLPSLVTLVVFGGIVGPLLMLFGVQRTSAVTASLLLNLEAPFTIAIAVVLFREHVGRRAVWAIGCILLGAVVLKLEPGAPRGEFIGAILLAGACAAWALDNNLTQRLAIRDPFAVVRIKTLVAGSFNLLLGLAFARGKLPPLAVIASALALGSVSYGVSVLLDAYALRLVGAAREAAYFATAPFFGAIAALWIAHESPRWFHGVAFVIMSVGAWLLLRDRHGHRHTHEALEHSHAHTHDEHHQHEHGGDDPRGEPHAHVHLHETITHDHRHVSDAHHRHKH